MTRDRQELEKIIKTLRPFARSAVALKLDAPDDKAVIVYGGDVILTAGDFRRARMALEEAERWLQSQ